MVWEKAEVLHLEEGEGLFLSGVEVALLLWWLLGWRALCHSLGKTQVDGKGQRSDR